MVAKVTAVYVCSACDAQHPKWVGRCSQCGKFGTVSTEGQVTYQTSRGLNQSTVAPAQTVTLASVASASVPKSSTGFAEVDRVLGGGIARGAVMLLTGEPGVGKSTLLLALADKQSGKVLYASGEEAAEQVSGRLTRLGLSGMQLEFTSASDISAVVSAARSGEHTLVVVDSLQTFAVAAQDTPPGSPSQVKAVMAELTGFAKATLIPVLVIGHVTKQGVAAGPKTIEHLVDVVLILEGDEHLNLRFLRTSKNRFGGTDEVGVFKMEETGFTEVSNPSELFLQERHQGSGACVTAVVEGSRALLIELQALVAKSRLTYPKRATTGFDVNRLQVLLAVLGERAGLKLDFSDVYINLAGGYKSREPALDLAVCVAAASAAVKKTLPRELVVFGEVGLGGEVRPVAHQEKRLHEAARLGFKWALIPPPAPTAKLPQGLEIIPVRHLSEAVEWVRH